MRLSSIMTRGTVGVLSGLGALAALGSPALASDGAAHASSKAPLTAEQVQAVLSSVAGSAGQHATPGASMLPMLIPALPLIGFALCGLCAVLKIRNILPAILTLGVLAASFGITLFTFLNHDAGAATVLTGFRWFDVAWGSGLGQSLVANFGLYIDGLTLLWMLFVTGLATVIALYSMEYMVHDVGLGYCRYFAAFNLFVFSMTCLVMGDNMLVTFLGWEGVGLCSYLLIGYYYKRPAAVAAAKKAFIVNRIGDLGLVLGVMSTFVVFGTVEYKALFEMIRAGVDASGQPLAESWAVKVIPILFALGAFGKSAQLFFYVWLPDAMEGPTPVSALIHAATMVTAGVFLIARLYPLFTADPHMIALTFVAWAGAITAFWAASIEMAIFDIKRVMGYSTISQLGYMFAGLGVLTPTGAAFHTFTHAFFKATLFLGVGAVMHGFGGQLDLRRLSGVMKMRGFGLVGIAMLIGTLNLSGVPGMAGYFSKDMILAQAFTTPASTIAGANLIGWLLLITAGMTAYYSFRTYFRVYMGPKQFVPGDDAELLDLGRHPKGTSLDEWHKQHGHGHGGGHGHDHGHGHGHGHGSDHKASARVDFDPSTEEFDPHPPGLAMKLAMGVCMLLSLAAAGLYFMKHLPHGAHGGWVSSMVHDSTAAFSSPSEGFNFLGITNHSAMYVISAVVGLIGIVIAFVLHLMGRKEAATANADKLLKIGLFRVLHRGANHKWYVDEIYDFLIRKPLLVVSHLMHILDKLVVDGLVNAAGYLPRALGAAVRPTQSGVLHGYAVGMAGGIAVLVLIVLLVAR